MKSRDAEEIEEVCVLTFFPVNSLKDRVLILRKGTGGGEVVVGKRKRTKRRGKEVEELMVIGLEEVEISVLSDEGLVVQKGEEETEKWGGGEGESEKKASKAKGLGRTSQPLSPIFPKSPTLSVDSQPPSEKDVSVNSFSSSVPASFSSPPSSPPISPSPSPTRSRRNYCLISVGGGEGYSEVGKAEEKETKMFLAHLKQMKKETKK